jgi:nucleotide-binding universal stress UspA family protein
MTIGKIVIPIRGDGAGENVLAHAAALARRFDAHVEAVHCRPRAKDLLPYGVPVPAFLKKQIAESATDLADEEEKTLRAEFDALLPQFGLTLGKGGSTASWREAAGKQIDVIRIHGRLADVVVVAKPDRDRNLGANTLRAALFNTGRPVMMCPMREDHPQTLCDHVSIAWNGSVEASRAVALTTHIISAASKVTVLTAGEDKSGASAEDLLDYLETRGVSAELDRFIPERSIGRSLLERSAAAGADTLIMGAYGDSHEKETVFGGNTQTVVDTAQMPVIMVH